MGQEENKEKKSWKSLLFNDGTESENVTQKPSIKETTKKSFPNQGQTTSSSNTTSVFDSHKNETSTGNNSSLNEEVVAKVKKSFAENFIKLNKPGYDFFEYFNSVRKAGPDKPGVFSMALDMASSMDGAITKDLLVAQAKDYIQQVNNMYASNQQKGEAKKTEILNAQQTEGQNLTAELQNLNEQMQALQNQIEDRQRRLSAVGSKYEGQIQDVEQRLMANDLVKNQMVIELEKVKTGLESL